MGGFVREQHSKKIEIRRGTDPASTKIGSVHFRERFLGITYLRH